MDDTSCQFKINDKKALIQACVVRLYSSRGLEPPPALEIDPPAALPEAGGVAEYYDEGLPPQEDYGAPQEDYGAPPPPQNFGERIQGGGGMDGPPPPMDEPPPPLPMDVYAPPMDAGPPVDAGPVYRWTHGHDELSFGTHHVRTKIQQ